VEQKFHGKREIPGIRPEKKAIVCYIVDEIHGMKGNLK
jgi:hypothetical protein